MVLEKQDSGICLAMDTGSPPGETGVNKLPVKPPPGSSALNGRSTGDPGSGGREDSRRHITSSSSSSSATRGRESRDIGDVTSSHRYELPECEPSVGADRVTTGHTSRNGGSVSLSFVSDRSRGASDVGPYNNGRSSAGVGDVSEGEGEEEGRYGREGGVSDRLDGNGEGKGGKRVSEGGRGLQEEGKRVVGDESGDLVIGRGGLNQEVIDEVDEKNVMLSEPSWRRELQGSGVSRAASSSQEESRSQGGWAERCNGRGTEQNCAGELVRRGGEGEGEGEGEGSGCGQEHLSTHKAVCCVLCRRKLERLNRDFTTVDKTLITEDSPTRADRILISSVSQQSPLSPTFPSLVSPSSPSFTPSPVGAATPPVFSDSLDDQRSLTAPTTDVINKQSHISASQRRDVTDMSHVRAPQRRDVTDVSHARTPQSRADGTDTSRVSALEYGDVIQQCQSSPDAQYCDNYEQADDPNESVWVRRTSPSASSSSHPPPSSSPTSLSSPTWLQSRAQGLPPRSPSSFSSKPSPPVDLNSNNTGRGGRGVDAPYEVTQGKGRGVGGTSRYGVGGGGAAVGGSVPPNSVGSGTVWQQRLQGAFHSLATKLSSKNSKSTDARSMVPMKTQDQKIYQLMLAKKEEEARERASRELLHHQWEAERREEQLRSGGGGTRVPTSRRSQTNEGVRSDKQLGGSGGASSGGSGGHGGDTPRSGGGSSGVGSGIGRYNVTPPARKEDEGEGQWDSRGRGKTSSASSSASRQQNKYSQSKEKQTAAMEKRRSVEQRLEQQRREMEEHKRELREKQEQDLQRANSVRLSREQQNALKAKLKNVAAQQKMEKINLMKQQSMLELNELQTSIEAKLSHAEQKRRKELDSKRQQRDELEQKIEQSRLRQQQAETELKNWQQELLQFKQWQGQHADELAREAVLRKKEAACRERLQKEQLQRENMKRLLNEEEQWLADVEASIVAKDVRSILINKDKEDMIQHSRAMASNSQRMREELRSHYSTNDLDQWHLQATFENRLVAKTSSKRGSITSLATPQ